MYLKQYTAAHPALESSRTRRIGGGGRGMRWYVNPVRQLLSHRQLGTANPIPNLSAAVAKEHLKISAPSAFFRRGEATLVDF